MKSLRDLRASSGKTQKQIAEEMGVSHDTMRRWETGETHPTAPDAIKLVKLYGVAVDAVDWVIVRTAAPEDQSMKVTEQ